MTRALTRRQLETLIVEQAAHQRASRVGLRGLGDGAVVPIGPLAGIAVLAAVGAAVVGVETTYATRSRGKGIAGGLLVGALIAIPGTLFVGTGTPAGAT